jgi:anaerobic magnesium-protoporphyrin IX monomethyl ester cyclase
MKKLRIVLINPRFRSWSPTVLMPLGLTYIAAVLEGEGHTVEMVDMNAEKVSERQLCEKMSGANFVGITGMITEYQQVLEIINIVKRVNKEIIVVLGGPLATTLPQDLLQNSQADYIVIGEGEKTIIDLLQTIEDGKNPSDVKGIAYKNNSDVIITEQADQISNLDNIPFPARHLLNFSNYLQNQFHSFKPKMEGFGIIKSTNMITSRGCPYSCTFCFKDIWGQKWRGRSPGNVVAEMEFLYAKYGINGFFFNDDTFVLDTNRVFEFCNLLKEKQLKAAWYCNGRVNLMTQKMLAAMYDAGCREIAYGIESGNQQMLDALKKNITLEQVRNVVKWTKEAGINANGFFIIGLPGETKESIRQTINFAEELDMDFYGFSLLTPLSGTEIYRQAVERGLIRNNLTSLKAWDFDVNANLTADCSDEELVEFQNEIFRKFPLKNFGKFYMFNPVFLKRVLKVLISLRSWKEAKDLAKKAAGIIKSYWKKV